MNRRLALLLLVLVVAVMVLGIFRPGLRRAPAPSPGPDAAPKSSPSAALAPAVAPVGEPLPPVEVSHLADALNAPGGDIRADLRILVDVLATFRTNFPRGGNPVGSNAEITAVLTGQNTLRLAFIPPHHPAINRAGELCDRWGTPFFFHAESGTRMSVRSAGPDRKMWTADDLELAP